MDGVRSKVSPAPYGAGLPGPIAVRDDGSAVGGILPFDGKASTDARNMQELPCFKVRCIVIGEGEYPSISLSS